MAGDSLQERVDEAFEDSAIEEWKIDEAALVMRMANRRIAELIRGEQELP